jgi:hypothetical protein
MTSTLLTLTLVLFAAEPEKTDKPPRKPSGVAPSLPALTREEEDKLDGIVNRLIDSDIGRLRGEEARKAVKEFEALKPEAIPALIRGLNRSAKLSHSCPVLLISKKLQSMLMASNDQQLLEFARDEIGAGVGRTRYSSTLQDLRVKCMLRKNHLARLAPPPPKGIAAISTPELAKLTNSERGPRLNVILKELAKRTGKEVVPALAFAAESYEKDIQKLGRELLDSHLARQSSSQVLEKLDDDSAEVRKSAIRVIGSKHPDYLDRVIDRIVDDSADVRAVARAVLVKAARGEDFGPEEKADKDGQRGSQSKWRDWWKRRVEK